MLIELLSNLIWFKLQSSDKLKRLQCSLDSEGYGIVLNKSSNKIAQLDLKECLNLYSFLFFVYVLYQTFILKIAFSYLFLNFDLF